MNKRILTGFLVILIIAVIIFMVTDLFFKAVDQENPFELNTGNLKKYDTSLVSYREIFQIKTGIKNLAGVAVDNYDNVVAAGEMVKIYNRNFKQTGEFKLPGVATCVVCSNNHGIFLGLGNHIEVRTMKGELIRDWKVMDKESIFCGLAVDDSSIYIADAGERIVHHFFLDGRFINNIGGGDKINGVPKIVIRSAYFDVAVGTDNELWLSNPGKYLLESFDFKGNFQSSWGRYSESIEGFGGCCNPTNFAILKDGSFVTAEKAFPRVKVYTPDGKFSCLVAGTDKFDEEAKGLDIAVDSKSRIYILDPVRLQIRIFEKFR